MKKGGIVRIRHIKSRAFAVIARVYEKNFTASSRGLPASLRCFKTLTFSGSSSRGMPLIGLAQLVVLYKYTYTIQCQKDSFIQSRNAKIVCMMLVTVKCLTVE